MKGSWKRCLGVEQGCVLSVARSPQSRHELVVAFQGGVQPGAVNDHARLLVVAHLLEGERTADHVASKALLAIGIVGFAADPVVHREAGVTPLEHAFSECGNQAAEFAEVSATMAKERPN